MIFSMILFLISQLIKTYNFSNLATFEGEYNSKTLKYFAEVCFIGINAFIFLGCLYVLIFILIPIIKFRISQCLNKGRSRSDKKASMQALIKEWFDISLSDDAADAIGIGKYVADTNKKKNEIIQFIFTCCSFCFSLC